MTNDMPDTPPSRPARSRRPLVIGAVVIGAIIGYAAVANFDGMWRSAAPVDPTCKPAVAMAKKLAPLQIPDLAFKDADGQPKKLSDWRGRTVLVNLWATWCVPCRKEMPALDE